MERKEENVPYSRKLSFHAVDVFREKKSNKVKIANCTERVIRVSDMSVADYTPVILTPPPQKKNLCNSNNSNIHGWMPRSNNKLPKKPVKCGSHTGQIKPHCANKSEYW